MKQMELFEPAMCCESGTCGPSVDPELLRIKGIVALLGENGIVVKRHNLSTDPQSFLGSPDIQKLIAKYGVDALPVTVIDGKALFAYAYPTDQDFVELLDLKDPLAKKVLAFKERKSCCCGGDASCGCESK